jgi:hypothetical protein
MVKIIRGGWLAQSGKPADARGEKQRGASEDFRRVW